MCDIVRQRACVCVIVRYECSSFDTVCAPCHGYRIGVDFHESRWILYVCVCVCARSLVLCVIGVLCVLGR